jgi:FeS assembly protein IscX
MSSKSQINWSNIDEIVESLIEKYDEMKSESFISEINFVILKKMVQDLPNFYEDGSCNEKKLEAIQQALLDEC